MIKTEAIHEMTTNTRRNLVRIHGQTKNSILERAKLHPYTITQNIKELKFYFNIKEKASDNSQTLKPGNFKTKTIPEF